MGGGGGKHCKEDDRGFEMTDEIQNFLRNMEPVFFHRENWEECTNKVFTLENVAKINALFFPAFFGPHFFPKHNLVMISRQFY